MKRKMRLWSTLIFRYILAINILYSIAFASGCQVEIKIFDKFSFLVYGIITEYHEVALNSSSFFVASCL